MAAVLNRTTLQYLPSVNTPDYPVLQWVIEPDLSAVVGVPHRYWKLTGDVVSEMTAPEKAAVDADLLAYSRKRAQADLALSANVREQLEAAYAYVTGEDAPAAVREEAQAITAPYIETGKPQLSRKFSIDWDSVVAAGKGEQIVNAARKLRARRMDEEAVILALL